jgi:hypothetical protein
VIWVLAISLLLPRWARNGALGLGVGAFVCFAGCSRLRAAMIGAGTLAYYLLLLLPEGSGTIIVLGAIAAVEGKRAFDAARALIVLWRGPVFAGRVAGHLVETDDGPIICDLAALGDGTEVVLVGEPEQELPGAAYRASASPPVLAAPRLFFGESALAVRRDLARALRGPAALAAIATGGALLQAFAGA